MLTAYGQQVIDQLNATKNDDTSFNFGLESAATQSKPINIYAGISIFTEDDIDMYLQYGARIRMLDSLELGIKGMTLFHSNSNVDDISARFLGISLGYAF